MRTKNLKRLPIAIGSLGLVGLLLGGCASTKVEDPAKSRAAGMENISQQWKQGSDLVTAGEKTKAKGSELVAEGQRQVAEGESQISRGRTLMAESETAFRDASRQASAKQGAAK
jgi:hypothetical protein